MDKNAENYLKQKYREVFNGTEVEIHNAQKDIGNFIKNGAYWGTSKVAKHMLGESGVYETYAFTIIQDSMAPLYRKINAAKEACGYALGKKNVEQFLRFLAYGADLNGHSALLNELAYKCASYYAKENIKPKNWFYVYAEQACEVAFRFKLRNDYVEFNTKIIYICAQLFNGHDNAIYLYLLGLAYYGMPEEKRFIEDCKRDSKHDAYYREQLNKAKQMWCKHNCYTNI